MFQVLPQRQRHRNELNKVIDFAELMVFSGVRLRVRVKGRSGRGDIQRKRYKDKATRTK